MSIAISDSIARDVERAQSGDLSAFEKLVVATQNMTTTIALAIVKDVDASEDVAQQVYVKVWQQLTSLQNASSFLPWLRQMTRYTAINYLRDNKVAQRVASEHAELLLHSLEDEMDVVDTLDKKQLNQMVTAYVDDLPEESRELVLLYYREEQSTRQVAELLDISEVSVRQKLSRVRQKLKTQWLAKYGRLVLTTAPGLGFTTFILNAIAGTAPVAAATLTASASSGKTSLLSKLGVLLGGSVMGAALAIFAVFVSHKILLSRIEDQSFRPKLIFYRNIMFAWIAVFALLLTLSFELTTGWWAPVLSYCLFALGLVKLVTITQLLSAQAGMKANKKWCIEPDVNSWKRRIINWAGPIMGGVGLLQGLYNAGRLWG